MASSTRSARRRRELAPLRLWRDVLLALAEGRRDEARAAAEEMEAALEAMGPNAVLEHRIMARYDLAKFWSREGEDAKAFAQWRAGHALLQPIQPFSREATRAYNDAAIATFTPERFASGPRASNADPAPVFIVGMPRSGTTLAEQIVAAHPQAYGAGERAGARTACLAAGRRRDAGRGRPHRRARRGRARRGGRAPISRSCMRSRPARRASSTRCRATISMSG